MSMALEFALPTDTYVAAIARFSRRAIGSAYLIAAL